METKIEKDYDYSIEKAREILNKIPYDYEGFKSSVEGDSIVFTNEKIIHKVTKQPLVLKVEIEINDMGELTGRFPIKRQNEAGEWVFTQNSINEDLLLSGGSPRNNVEKWKQDKEGQMQNLLHGCMIMLFYNNWGYCKHLIDYKNKIK